MPRPRKPTAQKKAQGTYRPDRDAGLELPEGIPAPPGYLTELALVYWDRMIEVTRAAKVLTKALAKAHAKALAKALAMALVTALAGAEAASMKPSAEFILENMSARMADSLREEVSDKGTVTSADMEDAMASIVQSIRAMESSGELLLIVDEGDAE